MGWILCLGYSITYAISGNVEHLFASALFGVAGAISEVASAIRNRNVTDDT